MYSSFPHFPSFGLSTNSSPLRYTYARTTNTVRPQNRIYKSWNNGFAAGKMNQNYSLCTIHNLLLGSINVIKSIDSPINRIMGSCKRQMCITKHYSGLHKKKKILTNKRKIYKCTTVYSVNAMYVKTYSFICPWALNVQRGRSNNSFPPVYFMITQEQIYGVLCKYNNSCIVSQMLN